MAPTNNLDVPKTTIDKDPTKESLAKLINNLKSTLKDDKSKSDQLAAIQVKLDAITDDKQLQALRDLQGEIDTNFKDQLKNLRENVADSNRLKTNVLADIKLIKPQLDKIKSGKSTDADKEQAIQGIKQIRATVNTGYAGMLSAEVKNEFIKATNDIEFVTANLENAAKYNEAVELNDGKKGWNDRRNERKADRAENKADKVKSNIDRNGLYGAVCKLESALGTGVDLGTYHDEIHKANAKESTAQTLEATAAATQIATAIKSGADKETVGGVVNKIVDDKIKSFVTDKMGWSDGAYDLGKFIGALWLGFEALGIANDQFPGGLKGLMLKAGAAYAVYAGYNKYEQDIIDGIKKATGEDISKSKESLAGELSHRKLESTEFTNGEKLFKGILARFTDANSAVLGGYITSDGINIGQLMADYTGEDRIIGTDPSNKPYKVDKSQQAKLHAVMSFPKDTKEYDHMGRLDGQILGGRGAELKKTIDAYLKGVGIAGPLSIQGCNEKFTEYENIQKVRYNILKKAGYEMDLTQGDKRSEVDNIIKPSTHLNTNYSATDAEKNQLAQLLFLKPIIAQSTELTPNETAEIDAFTKQWKMDGKLDAQSKNSLYRAYLSLKNKTIGGIKLDPKYQFPGGEYPALIIGKKVPVPLSLISATSGAIGFNQDYITRTKSKFGKIDTGSTASIEHLFERALLFANATSNFAGRGPIGEVHKDSVTGRYKYFDHDMTRGMYFVANSGIIASLTSTTSSEQVFDKKSLQAAGLSDSTQIDPWLDWLSNSFNKTQKNPKTGESRTVPLWSNNYGYNPFVVGFDSSNVARHETVAEISGGERVKLRLKSLIDDYKGVGGLVFDEVVNGTVYVFKGGALIIKKGGLALVDAVGNIINDKNQGLLKHSRTALLSMSEIAVSAVDQIVTQFKDKDIAGKFVDVAGTSLVKAAMYGTKAIDKTITGMTPALKNAVNGLMGAIAAAFPDNKEKAKAMAVIAGTLIGIRFKDDGLGGLIYDGAEKGGK